jgi:hypothetical protein
LAIPVHARATLHVHARATLHVHVRAIPATIAHACTWGARITGRNGTEIRSATAASNTDYLYLIGHEHFQAI